MFENESHIANSLKDFIKYVNKVIPIVFIYFLYMFIIQKYTLISIISSIIISLILYIRILKGFDEIIYQNSKRLGGKRSRNVVSINNVLETYIYNLNLMKKDEIKLVENILKTNRLYNIECMTVIKEYFEKNDYKEGDLKSFVKDLISLFLIPIFFGIIGIATFVGSNLKTEEKLSFIQLFVLLSILCVTGIVCAYIISKIKNFSITKSYTKRKINQILTELLLRKYRLTNDRNL